MDDTMTTPRAERERIEQEIERLQSAIGHKQCCIEKLEAELATLDTPAPWTPKVGDEVWCRGRVITTDPVDEECEVGFTTHFTSTAFVELGNLRPAAPAPELPEWPEWMTEEWQTRLGELCVKYREAFNSPREYAPVFDEMVAFIARTAPVPVEQPDAEPVGYGYEQADGVVRDLSQNSEYLLNQYGYLDGNLFPVYRHPAPAQKLTPEKAATFLACWYSADNREHLICWPITVGGKSYNVTVAPHDPSGYVTPVVAGAGVTDDIKRLAKAYADAAVHCHALNCQMDGKSYCATVRARDEFHAAVSRVTVLPEPSDEYLNAWQRCEFIADGKIVYTINRDDTVSIGTKEMGAAALIAAAQEPGQ